MSFSSKVKEELSMLATLNNKRSVKAELIGYLITNNISLNEKNIKFSTENEYNINRFSKLLNNMGILNYEIDIQGKVYTICVKRLEISEKINLQNIIDKENIIEDEICKKSIVRGAFLGGGSVNNPENKYHLEILLSAEKYTKYIIEILKEYQIECKILDKNNKFSLYCKEGETISKFLAFIGASNSVLKFEEIRVVRDMRNNVNRLVNCETANLNKTINASLKQIDDINLIKAEDKFKNLPNNLQEIAELRIKNPEASLLELGQMLLKPVSKSGVNHRLKAIQEIAEEIRRGKKGENI